MSKEFAVVVAHGGRVVIPAKILKSIGASIGDIVILQVSCAKIEKM